MVEVNASLAAEKLNKQAVDVLEQFREVFRGYVRNAFQSGYFAGELPPTGEAEIAIATSQRQPFLQEIMDNPAETPEERLRASKEFQSNEAKLRKQFPS